jgi:dihydropteroate synthase
MRYLHITSPSEALETLKRIDVDPFGIEAMVPKMENINILLEEIECKVANIMKQEMLSIGGDVAVARGSVDCSIDKTDVVIMGTTKHVTKFVDKVSVQQFGLKEISENIKKLLSNIEKTNFILRTPERKIELGSRTMIMGIINMTPDSFSDGGMFNCVEEAVEYGVKLEGEGADFLDVGGESSRPGSAPVSAEEERERVIPLVKGLKRRVKVPVSIDTTKAKIARAAIDEGAEIINDISAMRFDEKMSEVAAGFRTPVILMHMKGTPKTMQEGDISYRSLMSEIIRFSGERIEKAEAGGIDIENIIIDPGIGFGKTTKDNLRLLKYLKEFKTLGRPILAGASRKRFIGEITGGDLLDRLEGTAATATAAIMNGAHILRVHDVKFMKKVSTMADAIVRG